MLQLPAIPLNHRVTKPTKETEEPSQTEQQETLQGGQTGSSTCFHGLACKAGLAPSSDDPVTSTFDAIDSAISLHQGASTLRHSDGQIRDIVGSTLVQPSSPGPSIRNFEDASMQEKGIGRHAFMTGLTANLLLSTLIHARSTCTRSHVPRYLSLFPMHPFCYALHRNEVCSTRYNLSMHGSTISILTIDFVPKSGPLSNSGRCGIFYTRGMPSIHAG